MPGWGDILSEINAAADPNTGAVDIDGIRLKYIQQVTALTNRPLVIYASDWTNKGGPQTSITLADMVGLMEVFRDQTGRELDLILHSPGGQAEACDRLVRYMRSKFDHVRVFIPLGAMSAATMWAMAADEIVMGKHSQLGPIDPQVTMPSGWTMPAGALLTQFKEASDQCAAEPARLTGWLPTLQQYPPGLLNLCENAADLAKSLVEEWLRTYMLKGDPAKAKEIAEWLADDTTHLSHSRAITREDLEGKGLAVTPLEADQALQDAVLSVFHVLLHTFNGSAVKIIENQLGRRWIQHGGVQMVVNPGAMPAPMPAP
jgi:hypothetical protein